MTDHNDLFNLIEKHGIEQALMMICVDDVEDITLRIILRTIEHSLERLHAEIEELSQMNDV